MVQITNSPVPINACSSGTLKLFSSPHIEVCCHVVAVIFSLAGLRYVNDLLTTKVEKGTVDLS